MRSLLPLCLVAASMSCLVSADLLPYFSSVMYNYTLQIHLDDNSTQFTGIANLTLRTDDKVNLKAKDFVVNAAGLEISEVTIWYPNTRRWEVSVKSIKQVEETIIIPGREYFVKNGTYLLRIMYTGRYNISGGLFRSSYKSKNYVSTRLYPTYSRWVFPSLDQPGNVVPVGLKIDANSTSKFSIITGLKLTTTVGNVKGYDSEYAIPSSAIFFTVGDYSPMNNKKSPQLQAPPGFPVMGITFLSNVMQLQAIKNLYLGLGEPSIVLVPDLPSPSARSLGITALSSELGYQAVGYTVSESKAQAIEIISSLIKSLYGSVVSPKTWMDLWITESTALYLAESYLSQLPEWNRTENFIPDSVDKTLRHSWSENSMPVQSNLTTPAEVLDYLKDPAIAKGATILRMIDHLSKSGGETDFFSQYLQMRKGKSVTTEDFLAEFSNFKQINTTTGFPEGKTLQDIMKPWLEETGYPALILERQEKDILANEVRYGYPEKSNSQDSNWIIPIQFKKTTNATGANDATEIMWLVPGPNAQGKLVEGLDEGSTVTVNNDGQGIYPTVYDEKDLEIITNILKQNLQEIPAAARATIIRDSFAFAKLGQLKYSDLFNMLTYLVSETELQPWQAATTGFQELWGYMYFQKKDCKIQFENYSVDLIRPEYRSIQLNPTDSDRYNVMLRSAIIKPLCDYYDVECREDTANAFRDRYRTEGQMTPDIQQLLYCNGLRNLTDATVFKEFLATNYTTKLTEKGKRNVFSYLACPRDENITKLYLSYLLVDGNEMGDMKAEDVVMGFEEVASRPEHLDYSFSFLANNFDKLKKKLAKDHKVNMIKILGQKGSTDLHIESLKNFDTTNNTYIKEAVDEALKNVQTRQQFIAENIEDIELGLFGYNPSPSYSPPPPPTDSSPTSSDQNVTSTKAPGAASSWRAACWLLLAALFLSAGLSHY